MTAGHSPGTEPAPATGPAGKRARARGMFSPLTRRILAINILALGILAGGVLYLDRFERELIDSRVGALMTQGEIIAGALGEAAISGPEATAIERITARRILRRLVVPGGTRARLFGVDGDLLLDSRDLLASQQVLTRELAPYGNGGPWGWIRKLYEGLAGPFAATRELEEYRETPRQRASDYRETAAALAGAPGFAIRQGPEGSLVLTVAQPVQRLKRVLGALMLSLEDREIETAVREQRLNILAVFAAVLTGTVLLSLFLASTIARPVRKLAEAADRVSKGVSERVTVPDFTARSDEIGDLSAALGAMTETLYRRLDAIEAFAADVAHEIKNPLSSLRSAVEAVARTDDPEQQRRLFRIIQDDVARLDRLITDISDASRLDAELSRAPTEAVDMGALLAGVAEIYRSRREDGDAATATPELETRVSSDQPLIVRGLAGRLGQAVQNLLDNAVSFSPAGGTLRLSADRRGAWIVVTVEDDGPGIPEHELEAVFDRFYTERPSRETFGKHSGLGLSIARQIAEAHGGTITAANRSGGGACLTLRLPA